MEIDNRIRKDQDFEEGKVVYCVRGGRERVYVVCWAIMTAR